jgi:hypothetical protein
MIMPKQKSKPTRTTALSKSNKKDEGKKALDELYKDGRFPTLQELADVVKEHEMKFVSVTFPSGKEKDKTPQISDDELEFYIHNHLRLAEVEKTLAVTYGEIKAALDTQQAVSSPVHYTTMKSNLDDKWLFIQLKMFKEIFPDGDNLSPRLSDLRSQVVETMQFIETSFPDRSSWTHVTNADRLIMRLEKLGNVIGEIRSLAETRLISSIEKK